MKLTLSSLRRQVKVSQGWQVVGTVGAAEVGVDVPVLHCSDFLLTKPTLLLIGEVPVGAGGLWASLTSRFKPTLCSLVPRSFSVCEAISQVISGVPPQVERVLACPQSFGSFVTPCSPSPPVASCILP